ncbi:MAG: DNA repair protein RecN [Candidatus Glassbacteria bacterium RIFCSPLOWO2_12_FULL_58_11]|uniref:DNA repair protein RecN n=1 Tax=Candidatus Glassbacteria bacterium RIFCSPLOWO2_12_FULL_58_11 TaxID=1817867 RepID=A0A1F5Z329_9BACT|nr:MAG: DNA repair protein RecN [Candidatus Glassbacteria bacterium RIFCSPLOWO2_12_FULL_58_11]
MLQVLRVTDFVLFDRVDIEFGDHLNVISGETGAGKSILLGAVELLLGGETSSLMLRAGAEKALVEGLFSLGEAQLGQLKEEGVLTADSGPEIVIRREISASGRSRCFVDGALANLAMLRRLGEELIQVHGQQEHQMLVKPVRQLELLDFFGGLEPQRKTFAALLNRYRQGSRRLAELEEGLERRQREAELARFQRDEIDRAGLSLEEEKALEEEIQLLENSEKISEALSGLLEALEGEAGGLFSAEGRDVTVLSSLGGLRRVLESLSAMTGRAAPLLEQFEGARYALEEVARGLRDLQAGLEHDPGRLEQVRNRLDELFKLKKKYGSGLEEVFAFREKLEARLAEAGQDEYELAGLRAEIRELSASLAEAAANLTQARKQSAVRLGKEVSRRLSGLGMSGGRFEIEFAGTEAAGSGTEYLTSGADRITFLLSTNPGIPLMPLSEVASGGELSRIMLAVKSSLVEIESPSTMIFDEVDAGIGGKVGGMVGVYLDEIAQKNQVLVITHLASIAGFADIHLLVEKFTEDGRTTTRVRGLTKQERPAEIARMLGGDAGSETSLAHARQILQASRKGEPAR